LNIKGIRVGNVCVVGRTSRGIGYRACVGWKVHPNNLNPFDTSKLQLFTNIKKRKE
jgi:hypothetical protein